MVLLLLALQAASLPDISLHATATARAVTIEKRGEATLDVHANPDGGSLVKVDAPKGNGTKTLRNVRVNVVAEAQIEKGVEAAATLDEAPR